MISGLLAAPLILSLSACSGLTMPKLPAVKMPFVGDDSTAPADDPHLPYSLKQRLGPGYTLEITAYAGQRSPKKFYSGTVMVDDEGAVDLGRYGRTKLAGLDATQAVAALEGTFRKMRSESLITVHVKSIEGVPLLQVNGAVVHPGMVLFLEGANTFNILPLVGGRKASAKGTAVFVTRDGVRRFQRDFEFSPRLQAGDIVTYSEDL